MLVFDWLRRGRRRSRPHPQPTRRRRSTHAVEALEDRTLLSVDLVSMAFPIDVEVTDSVISADGRFVAFTSPTPDVIPSQVDTNNRSDVFLFDRDTGVTTLISHTGDGKTAGNDVSQVAGISADGSTIVFESNATDLVTGTDSFGTTDVFTSSGGTVTLISHSTAGATTAGNGHSRRPVISADGSTIAFESTATDLVTGSDTNGTVDVFSATGGAVTLVSHSTNGVTTTGNRSSQGPVISADGATIAFQSSAMDLVAGFVDANGPHPDVFASSGGVVTLISHSTAGATITGNYGSLVPVISADGSTIAFESLATDLVPGFVDANSSTNQDIFVSSGGIVTLISHSTAGATTSGNDISFAPQISGDGTTIVFGSGATDLVNGFVDANGSYLSPDVFAWSGGTLRLISHSTIGETTTGNQPSGLAAVSFDGSTIVFMTEATDLVDGFVDANGLGDDVFAWKGGTVTLISHSIDGVTISGNGRSDRPAISADGSAITFRSRATDLVSGGGTAIVNRLFASDAGGTILVPHLIESANGESSFGFATSKYSVSHDGRFLVFQSTATNLIAGQNDTNNADDVFLLDRLTGTVSLVSHTGDGMTTGNGPSSHPVISGDGSTVAFSSEATDLIAGFVDNNNHPRGGADLFVVSGGTTRLVNHIGDGVSTGNARAGSGIINYDGSVIAFTTASTNQVPGQIDGNLRSDVFTWSAGAVALISHSATDTLTTSDGESQLDAMDRNGTSIVFTSTGTNLVPGQTDGNGSVDVFAYTDGGLTLISQSTAGPNQTGNGSSSSPVISADGSTIAFTSNATDLVDGIVDTNDAPDVYRFSLGSLALVSQSSDNPATTANAVSAAPSINNDGSTIAFHSRATNLVAGQVDSPLTTDVFAASGGIVTLISHIGDGLTAATGQSFSPLISGDGRTVVFTSESTSLVSGQVDVNGALLDVFASTGGVVTLVSQSTAGTATTGDDRSLNFAVSDNGREIIFDSLATDLVPHDNNHSADVFLFELAGSTEVSVDDQGFAIAETHVTGTSVGTVLTNEPDAGQSLTFAITGGNTGGAFAIDPLTGEITVANAAALDHEAMPQFLLTVEVTDNGTPQLSDTATITIDVLDVNEPPTVDDQQFSVSDDAQPRDVVGTVVAGNPDDGQVVTFAIISGNTEGAFAIDPQTGEITVARGLAHDSTPQFLLTVEVTDNGSPQLSETATITIDVTEGLPTDVIFVNDGFTQAHGTVIADADPNTPGDQPAMIGVNAFAELQDALSAVDIGGLVRVTDDLASDGPGMYAGTLIINRDVTIESTEGDRTAVVIDGGNATRVATIAGGARVVLANVTLQNGRVLSGGGGGLGVLNGASATLLSVDVLSSSAEFGGGILVDEATIVLNDTRVSGNTAGTAGGGIFNVGGSVTLDGGRIENNTAGPRGGGISLSQDGSTLDVAGTTFQGNAADRGGGLDIGSLITGTLSIANATFQANHATSGNGGAIFVAGGDLLDVTDTLISSNSASVVGGGIYSIAPAVTLTRSTLSNNSAGRNGGGAAVNGSGNRLDLLDTRVEQNTAGLQGGGLWNGSSSVMVLTAASQVTANRASGETHSGGGGGIYNNGGRLALAGGVLVEQNTADGSAGAGGGIFTTNGVVTLSESTVRGNTASRAGGGIEFVSGILEVADSQIDDNAATGGGVGAPGDGGGIHVFGLMGQVGRINIIGGSVSGNTAVRQGGGLWHQHSNILVVRGGALIDGNTASGDAATDGGGGIFNNGGRLAVAGGVTISNNVADGAAGSGGGIFSTGSGVSIAGGTVISGNSANRAGGGIEVINGVLTVNDSTIENNDAGVTGTANSGHGGGVHVSGTSFTRVDLWNAIVRNNSAAGQGGGLWNQVNGVMLVRVGSQVTGNTAGGDAADDGGGGIYNQGGRLIVNNATIDGNIADGMAGSGGGVFTRNGVVTVENVTISNNTAHRAGGGVEIIDGWFFTRNMDLTGNNAGGTAPNPGDGGGLHVTGTDFSRVRIDGGTIADNTASGSGGGLWHQAGSLMVIFGGTTIENNTAAGDAADAGGGGIFNAGGRLAITAATLTGNSANGANGSGGGILSLGGGLTLDNSTVSGNQANGDGGGVVSNGEFVAANATIVGNRSDADASGGGSGGGLFNGGLATINNTIVAGNLVGAGSPASDISGNNLRPASAHNIVGDAASAGGLIDGSNFNIVGNAGIGVLALSSIVNPTLADNGGPTLTHALTQNSPAIDAGSNNLAKDVAGAAFGADQRGLGFPRIINDTVDIGAVEA